MSEQDKDPDGDSHIEGLPSKIPSQARPQRSNSTTPHICTSQATATRRTHHTNAQLLPSTPKTVLEQLILHSAEDAINNHSELPEMDALLSIKAHLMRYSEDTEWAESVLDDIGDMYRISDNISIIVLDDEEISNKPTSLSHVLTVAAGHLTRIRMDGQIKERATTADIQACLTQVLRQHTSLKRPLEEAHDPASKSLWRDVKELEILYLSWMNRLRLFFQHTDRSQAKFEAFQAELLASIYYYPVYIETLLKDVIHKMGDVFKSDNNSELSVTDDIKVEIVINLGSQIERVHLLWNSVQSKPTNSQSTSEQPPKLKRPNPMDQFAVQYNTIYETMLRMERTSDPFGFHLLKEQFLLADSIRTPFDRFMLRRNLELIEKAMQDGMPLAKFKRLCSLVTTKAIKCGGAGPYPSEDDITAEVKTNNTMDSQSKIDKTYKPLSTSELSDDAKGSIRRIVLRGTRKDLKTDVMKTPSPITIFAPSAIIAQTFSEDDDIVSEQVTQAELSPLELQQIPDNSVQLAQTPKDHTSNHTYKDHTSKGDGDAELALNSSAAKRKNKRKRSKKKAQGGDDQRNPPPTDKNHTRGSSSPLPWFQSIGGHETEHTCGLEKQPTHSHDCRRNHDCNFHKALSEIIGGLLSSTPLDSNLKLELHVQMTKMKRLIDEIEATEGFNYDHYIARTASTTSTRNKAETHTKGPSSAFGKLTTPELRRAASIHLLSSPKYYNAFINYKDHLDYLVACGDGRAPTMADEVGIISICVRNVYKEISEMVRSKFETAHSGIHEQRLAESAKKMKELEKKEKEIQHPGSIMEDIFKAIQDASDQLISTHPHVSFQDKPISSEELENMACALFERPWLMTRFINHFEGLKMTPGAKDLFWERESRRLFQKLVDACAVPSSLQYQLSQDTKVDTPDVPQVRHVVNALAACFLSENAFDAAFQFLSFHTFAPDTLRAAASCIAGDKLKVTAFLTMKIKIENLLQLNTDVKIRKFRDEAQLIWEFILEEQTEETRTPTEAKIEGRKTNEPVENAMREMARRFSASSIDMHRFTWPLKFIAEHPFIDETIRAAAVCLISDTSQLSELLPLLIGKVKGMEANSRPQVQHFMDVVDVMTTIIKDAPPRILRFNANKSRFILPYTTKVGGPIYARLLYTFEEYETAYNAASDDEGRSSINEVFNLPSMDCPRYFRDTAKELHDNPMDQAAFIDQIYGLSNMPETFGDSKVRLSLLASALLLRAVLTQLDGSAGQDSTDISYDVLYTGTAAAGDNGVLAGLNAGGYFSQGKIRHIANRVAISIDSLPGQSVTVSIARTPIKDDGSSICQSALWNKRNRDCRAKAEDSTKQKNVRRLSTKKPIPEAEILTPSQMKKRQQMAENFRRKQKVPMAQYDMRAKARDIISDSSMLSSFLKSKKLMDYCSGPEDSLDIKFFLNEINRVYAEIKKMKADIDAGVESLELDSPALTTTLRSAVLRANDKSANILSKQPAISRVSVQYSANPTAVPSPSRMVDNSPNKSTYPPLPLNVENTPSQSQEQRESLATLSAKSSDHYADSLKLKGNIDRATQGGINSTTSDEADPLSVLDKADAMAQKRGISSARRRSEVNKELMKTVADGIMSYFAESLGIFPASAELPAENDSGKSRCQYRSCINVPGSVVDDVVRPFTDVETINMRSSQMSATKPIDVIKLAMGNDAMSCTLTSGTTRLSDSEIEKVVGNLDEMPVPPRVVADLYMSQAPSNVPRFSDADEAISYMQAQVGTTNVPISVSIAHIPSNSNVEAGATDKYGVSVPDNYTIVPDDTPEGQALSKAMEDIQLTACQGIVPSSSQMAALGQARRDLFASRMTKPPQTQTTTNRPSPSNDIESDNPDQVIRSVSALAIERAAVRFAASSEAVLLRGTPRAAPSSSQQHISFSPISGFPLPQPALEPSACKVDDADALRLSLRVATTEAPLIAPLATVKEAQIEIDAIFSNASNALRLPSCADLDGQALLNLNKNYFTYKTIRMIEEERLNDLLECACEYQAGLAWATDDVTVINRSLDATIGKVENHDLYGRCRDLMAILNKGDLCALDRLGVPLNDTIEERHLKPKRRQRAERRARRLEGELDATDGSVPKIGYFNVG